MWDPAAARRGVSVERQTFVIDLQTGKFAHVFHAVPAVGHAAAVGDVLAALLVSKDAARNTAAPALASPPASPPATPPAAPPAPAQPQAPAPPAAAPVSLKAPVPKPSALKDALPKPSASLDSQPALPPRSTGAELKAPYTSTLRPHTLVAWHYRRDQQVLRLRSVLVILLVQKGGGGGRRG